MSKGLLSMKHKFTTLLCAGLALCFATSAEANLRAGKYARVYNGTEGIEVTVVSLRHSTKEKLVLVTGIESKLDGVVLFHTEEDFGSGVALSTFVDDKKFWTLRSQESRWGTKRLALTLPESSGSVTDLWYDKKASSAVDADALVARYEKQVRDGTIQGIQVHTGSDPKPRTNVTFKRNVRKAADQCGKGIGAKIDWNSVKPAHSKSIPIASLCGLPADMLAKACAEAPDAKLADAISGFTCTVGATQNLSLDSGKRLQWRISAKAPVSREALRRQFSKIFKLKP